MPYPINPRPIFRQAMSMLENARCPECGRAYDADAAAEDYCPRMQPLHCSWCSTRLRMIHEFRAWQAQDAAAHRAKRQALRAQLREQ
ncbi:hypothetical protein [Dyella amyloliquefaciens]|uniref:hypothetical protein n=1 Tax=Dyella amyloliquefaciens TaxID=1770545 RepID=UPI00102E9AF0|nr:hypothetical protein [Dyella amyloliquefaciens]